MQTFKTIMFVVLLIVVLLVVSFANNWFGLEWKRFFGKKEMSIQRDIFEESKPYVHGKIQELGKHYNEYQRAKSAEDKEIIANIVRIQFTEFDEKQIKNENLRRFLVKIRDYK